MTFSPKQLASLKAPLSSRHVKERKQAGRALSYVEAWHAIDEANRIFGFDAWDRETVECRCVSERERTDKPGYRVSYVARVRICVKGIIREGTGAGHGIDADLGLAHESAIKEAESDAMKRALMTFGNPFGLALYDKEQANVTDVAVPDTHDESKERYLELCRGIIKGTDRTRDEWAAWWREEKQNRRDFGLTGPEETELSMLIAEKTRKDAA